MSSTAFKRDLADPKTIEDFVPPGAKPGAAAAAADPDRRRHPRRRPGHLERLEAQLLRTLFEAAEERLRLGHKQHGRAELVAARQEELAAELGWKASALRAHARRLPDSYWLAEPLDWQVANARQVRRGRGADRRCAAERRRRARCRTAARPASASSRLTARACSTASAPGSPAAGANIIDARIHTTRDGMALDNLLVLDGRGQAYADRRLRSRLARRSRPR